MSTSDDDLGGSEDELMPGPDDGFAGSDDWMSDDEVASGSDDGLMPLHLWIRMLTQGLGLPEPEPEPPTGLEFMRMQAAERRAMQSEDFRGYVMRIESRPKAVKIDSPTEEYLVSIMD